MERRDRGSRVALLLLPLLLLATPLLGKTRLMAGGVARTGREDLLAEAIGAAAAKLAQEPCASLLSEFRDADGRTLAQNLETTGQTPAGYLGLLVFFDGAGEERCADRSILAATTPGSRVVSICTPQFFERQRRDPALASVLLIHEALHTLGLGENPPSSKEITAAVIARCGR
ncbi:MAG TPA: hypothetical protein VIA29_00930 [Thermoanaerobaculia bacterium]|jgi:hypothetical protein